MAVRVYLTEALVRLFPDAVTELEVHADTVDDLLAALDSRWPGMRERLSDSRPAVRKHISIFVDGQRAGLKTPLTPGGQVYILTAMSGG